MWQAWRVVSFGIMGVGSVESGFDSGSVLGVSGAGAGVKAMMEEGS